MYNQITSNKRRTMMLMAIFIAIILLIGYFFGQYSNLGYGGLVLAIIISTIMALVSYYSGDKIALMTSGAKLIAKNENPYVYRIVENICITAGLPLPKVHLINDPAINAFATGRDPEHSSIAITTGAIDKLNNEELEGVIAHELSHVKNFDIRLMMVVIVLVGFISLITNWFLRMRLFGSRRDDREGGQLGAILMIVGLVLMILSPIIAQLIQLAISRKREYLADASAALLTRYPDGLANALEKIKSDNQPMQKASTATAHLFIASPFNGRKAITNMFSTHPPIEDRIKKLKEMTL